MHADDADCARHVGGDDRDDAIRSSHRIHAQRRRETVDRRSRKIAAHLHATSEEVRRVQGLQDDVGVGDCRVVITAIVASRPRIGASTARPDLEQTATVDERDRAAAGADRVDVEHRSFDRIPVDDRFPGEPRLAALQQRDIGRCAAHIESDDVALAGKTRRDLCANHASAWT